jgi:putative ABC transport system permease protein
VLQVGPFKSELTVVGWVDDTNYLGQSGLWVNLDTWRSVQNTNRPFAAVADDVVQALIVTADPDASSPAGDLPARIDAATNATTSLTRDAAVQAIPGIKEQKSTFDGIIYTTLAIVLAVVGLFFSLLTLERIGLFGVLKAVGASSRRLFVGVALQAIVVALIGFAIGSLVAIALALAIPAGAIPLQLTVGRFVFTGVALLVAAVLGSLISLRRVVRIDPASAIGSAT